MVDKQSKRVNQDKGFAERTNDPGFWKEIWQQIQLVFHLMRDPEVPKYLKLLPVAAVIYVFFPLDFSPDFYPVLGQLDDLTALVVGAKVFIEMAPPHVVNRHLNKLQKTVDDVTEPEDELKDAVIIDAEHEIIGESSSKRE